MKEFVEKLIERLKKEQYDMIKPYAGNGLASTMIAALDIAIEIVNQLAEEYNPSKSSSLAEQIADDLSAVLKEAKSMGCKEVKSFHHIPLENLEIVINALRAYNQDSTKNNQGWIPCSERLPKPGKRYLVTAVWRNKDFEKHSVYDFVYGSDGVWHGDNYEVVEYCEVIAWQPLLEPYKPTEQEG